MLGILIVLAGITVGVIGLLGAGVIHSPSQAAVLLLALVALHAIGGRQLLKGLLVGAGIFVVIHAYGVGVLEPLVPLIVVLFGFWVISRGLAGRRRWNRSHR